MNVSTFRLFISTAPVSENEEDVDDVKPSVDEVESVNDFEVDDFGTEAMEALDAVEESVLKLEVEVEVNILYFMFNLETKNESASHRKLTWDDTSQIAAQIVTSFAISLYSLTFLA